MEKIPVTEEYTPPFARDGKFHVRLTEGRFQNLRRLTSWPLLALFFGLTVSSEGFDPPPVDSSTPNPPPPNPAPSTGSPAGVNSVDSFSPPLHAERNGVGSKKGEKPKRKNPSNPPHPSLPGLNTAKIGSAHDVESDDDDPHWGPRTS